MLQWLDSPRIFLPFISASGRKLQKKKSDNEICRNCLSNPTQDDEIALQCWNMSLFSRQTFADRVVSVEGHTIELSGGFRAPHARGMEGGEKKHMNNARSNEAQVWLGLFNYLWHTGIYSFGWLLTVKGYWLHMWMWQARQIVRRLPGK